MAASVKAQCVSAAEEIGAAAFVIARHVSSAKRMGAVAFVIAQRVSAAQESELVPSSLDHPSRIQRHCASRYVRCQVSLVLALSSARKLSRMRARAQRRSQHQAAAPYNKRINSAPGGRPTRKVRCTLLAGYARRWAVHSEENEMSQERNLCLSAHRNRHGAKYVATFSHRAVFTAAQWLRLCSAAASSLATSLQLSRAASFRAQLRSSSAESQSVSLRVASSFAAHRRVVVRSDSAACASSFTCLRSTSLPNNALVPTANRHGPVGSRSQSAAPAAQRGRWA